MGSWDGCDSYRGGHEEGVSNHQQDVLRFAFNLYSILLSCTESDLFRICHSVKEGNGLEAIRLLMKRYKPRTPGTKRTLLKAIINNPISMKPDELENNLMKVEEYAKKYAMMAGSDLPEELKVTVIIDLCAKDFKEHLELSTREMTYNQARTKESLMPSGSATLSAVTSRPWMLTTWRATTSGGV